MTAERFAEVERLYHEACARGPAERHAFLAEACAGNEALAAEVESLLACRDDAAGFLEAAPPDAAGRGDLSDGGGLRPTAPTGQWTFQGRPWWVWLSTLPIALAAAVAYALVLAAPQPAGWRLALVKEADRPVAYRVLVVTAGTAAERAGFRPDDRLSVADVSRFASERRTGVPYAIAAVRSGAPATFTLILGSNDLAYWTGSDGARRLALSACSAAYLALAGILIFGRPRDRAARWGALLFAQLGIHLVSGAMPLQFFPETAALVRNLPLPIAVVMLLVWSLSTTSPAAAFGFSAVFPTASPIASGRWWPWWLVAVAIAATAGIDLEFNWLPVFAGPFRPSVPRFYIAGSIVIGVAFVLWALALFVANYRVAGPSERRRVRLVAAGCAISLAALIGEMVLLIPWNPLVRLHESSFWQAGWVLLLSAGAACMTYGILRHRVFDIHVIVRLGLRYAVARGALLSLLPLAGLVLVLDVVLHRSQPVADIAARRGAFYVGLGCGALALHARRKSWMDALDRRFFRERYDAYRLLAGVTDDVRRSESFDGAARQVIARIDEALHPESIALMLRQPGDPSFDCVASIRASVPPIPAGARLVGLARVVGRPLENRQAESGWLLHQLPGAEAALIRQARVEWLFQVSLGGAGAQAFLLLGPKRSEEPYSREDRQLLEAVTANLGLLLDREGRSGFAECAACGTCCDATAERCARDDGTLVRSPYSRTMAGRYRLDRRLGRGGMGVVYEAFDVKLKRPVAVKVIRPELIASADAIARFRREARAAASLSHPSIVSVFDFGVADDDRAYLVMELLRGQSLREALREDGAIEPGRVLAILRNVSSAVALAHENGLVHRDLKPENIFLARCDRGEVATILDFGLVKPIDAGANDTVAETLPGAPVGTPAYMSPEQQRGERPGQEWDVWALTVVAYEMLTGAHPHAAAGQARQGLSDSVAAFFERALSPDRALRPGSVRQFADDLESALSSTQPGAIA
jgi:hypothetical protein